MKRQEIEIAGRDVIDVVMEYDILALEEIVVTTGYNIKRSPKSSSTLNQVVGGEKLSEARQTSINSALAGKVTGIQFKGQSGAKLGNTGYVRLRGGSGFDASPKVIYVVDGTILPNTADLNLDDIDNISILSGPAAAAILGSQGANGAVIITTKKAKTDGHRSFGVELNSGFLSSFVYLLPNFQNDYAGGNISDLIKYTYKETDPVEWKTLDGKYYRNYSDDASWGPRMAGQEYIPWYAWYPGSKYSGTTAKLLPQPNNIREFFETGLTFNNNIAFNRTGEDFNIRVLFGNISTTGNLPLTSMKKNSFAVKTSYKIGKKFTIAANVNFFSTLTKGNFNDAYGNQASGIFNQWFHRDLDMNIMKELRGLRSPVGSLASWNHSDPPVYNPDDPILFYGHMYSLNPYTFRDYQKQYTKSDRLFGDVSLSYRIIEGLDFKVTYRRQQNNDSGELKQYAEIAESNENSGSLPGFGYYRNSTGYSIRENYETLLSFSRKFGKISLNANAGSDFFSAVSGSNTENTVNGLNVRNLFAISNSKDQPSLAQTYSAEKYRAVFIRGDIGFRDFVFGEFTVRNDWFSTLPPDNNSILSKSLGVSFVFSDLLKLSWISYGKLRASWGEIPTAIGVFVYPGSAYSVEQFQWDNNFVMKTPNELVDPAIKGDVKTQKEIGLDLRFLNNRVGINLTYWDGTEKNIPYKIAIPGFSGYSSMYLNTGKITKKGLDLTLSFIPLNLSNLKWDLNGTVSWLINNEVVKIANGIDRFVVQSLWGGGFPDLVHAEGYRWGQLFGSGMKMYNGKPELNADGSYVADPQKYFGSIIPDVTGGIQNTFRIMKNISVAANIDYQFGGKFWSLSEFFGTFSGMTARTTGLNDRGIPIRDPLADGGGVHVFGVDATTHEDVDYYIDAQDYFHSFANLGICDPFVYDLTYIKFRELTIGYDIPVGKIGNLGKFIQNANFSLIAQNFWLIYAKEYDFDPAEITYADGETGQFPSFRSFGMNLKINF
jgi:TonB-linked SusC/RagA family outer membrane protein